MQIPFNFISNVVEPHSTSKFNFFKPKPKHRKIIRTRQMTADELIIRLEAALDSQLNITLQCNVSFYTENVYQISGYLTMSENGQLILHSNDHKVATIVWPKSIRHITFND